MMTYNLCGPPPHPRRGRQTSTRLAALKRDLEERLTGRMNV
jgi:hypothetical protein